MSILKLLKHSDFSKRVWKILRGALAGQLILMAVYPILTRLYTPFDFGVFSFFSSIFSVLAVVSSMRLELAIPGAKTHLEATLLVVISILFGVFWCVVLLAFSYPVLHYIVEAKYIDAVVLGYWWVFSIGVFLMAVSNALTAWSVYFRKYDLLGKSRFNQSVNSAALQIVLGYFYAGPLGLIVGGLVGQFGGVLRLFLLFVAYCRKNLHYLSFGNIYIVFKNYIGYPINVMPAGFVSRLAINLPALLFVFFFGPVYAGFVAVATKLLSIPTLLVGRSITPALQQEFVKEDSGKNLLQTIVYLSIPAVSISIAVLFFGSEIFLFVFGVGWEDAGNYAKILVPMFLGQIIGSPFMQIFAVVGDVKSQLKFDFVRLFVVVLSIVVPVYFEMKFDGVLLIYSWTMFFVYFSYVYSAVKLKARKV